MLELKCLGEHFLWVRLGLDIAWHLCFGGFQGDNTFLQGSGFSPGWTSRLPELITQEMDWGEKLNGLMKQPDMSDSRKLLPLQGPLQERDGVTRIRGWGYTMAGTAKDPGWRGCLMGSWNHTEKWCSEQRERDRKNNLASPYFSTFSIFLVSPFGHSSWKTVGKDKQETGFWRKLGKRPKSKKAMTGTVGTNKYLLLA